MPATTTRLAIPYPLASDPDNVPQVMENLADRIDAIIGAESSGALSARPNPGNAGFKYFATDQVGAGGTTGVWYYDNGVTWVTVNPNIPIGGPPSTSLVGATASNGSSGIPADAGHVHARESFATGATTTVTPGASAGDGTSTSPARADHAHAMPAPPLLGITGEFRMGGWSAAPAGWLACDGSAVSRTTYAALFAAIGTQYGAGDGVNTFNLPDFRGRGPIGSGTGAGLTARTVGQTGGEENHVLSVAELAAHAHPVSDPGHNHGNTGGVSAHHTHNFPSTNIITAAPSSVGLTSSYNNAALGITGLTTSNESTDHVHGTSTARTGVTTTNTGSGTGHNNMQPFTVAMFIVKT